jgi:flagellar L-ring protein precursor FlgH
MPISRSNRREGDLSGRQVATVLAAACALLAAPAVARPHEQPIFAPSYPQAPGAPEANGAIFQGSFVPLTSGVRAGQVGDLITIQLVERTVAQKSTAAKTGRDGSIGITPPATGLLSFFKPSDIKAGGDQSFKGEGTASQSNQLSGQITVTIAQVYPNGTMLVRGEKVITINRGDERVQFSGLVRSADISPENEVLSTKVADARILYTGKGEIARASRQGWLQRFFSAVSPF